MSSLTTSLKNQSFSQLYKNSPSSFNIQPGLILEGCVIDSKKDVVVVDVGLKSPVLFLSEELRRYTDFLKTNPNARSLTKGERLIFYLDDTNGFDGDIVLSNSKALRALKNKGIWDSINNRKFVNGRILNHVNGGYSVGVGGLVTFLPKNQAFKTKHPELLIKSLRTFYVVKTNSSKRNVVISRKTAVNQWNRMSKISYEYRNTFNSNLKSKHNSFTSSNLEDRVSEWRKLLLDKSSTLE